jgi:hypothetical protein
MTRTSVYVVTKSQHNRHVIRADAHNCLPFQLAASTYDRIKKSEINDKSLGFINNIDNLSAYLTCFRPSLCKLKKNKMFGQMESSNFRCSSGYLILDHSLQFQMTETFLNGKLVATLYTLEFYSGNSPLNIFFF